MKYGYTIIYVSSVVETLNFYKKAFGFEIKFIHESNQYGELKTGETIIAFASHEMGDSNLDGRYFKADPNENPFGFELCFVTDDVSKAYNKAIDSGVVSVKEPEEKPWGQIVGYVRAVDGTIVEFCTPMNAY